MAILPIFAMGAWLSVGAWVSFGALQHVHDPRLLFYICKFLMWILSTPFVWFVLGTWTVVSALFPETKSRDFWWDGISLMSWEVFSQCIIKDSSSLQNCGRWWMVSGYHVIWRFLSKRSVSKLQAPCMASITLGLSYVTLFWPKLKVLFVCRLWAALDWTSNSDLRAPDRRQTPRQTSSSR